MNMHASVFYLLGMKQNSGQFMNIFCNGIKSVPTELMVLMSNKNI